MDGEMLFRILFLFLFFPGMIIRGYYSRKMNINRERRSTRDRLEDTIKAEGKFGAILLVVEALFLVGSLIGYFVFIPNPFWLNLPFPQWLAWIGVLLGILSLPLLAWVHYILGRYWDVTLTVRKNHTLVTEGPYKRIRHPMYTVHLVYFFSWVLVTSNLLFLINYLLTILLIALRIPKEEQMMLKEFGDEYRQYMDRTGRLLPRF